MRDRSVYYENRIANGARSENGHSDSFRLVPKDRITEEMLHRNRLRRGVALSTLLVALMLPYNWIMGAVVGISMGKVKSRRADSNRLPLLITSELFLLQEQSDPYLIALRSVY
jgi:hypothetical protein